MKVSLIFLFTVLFISKIQAQFLNEMTLNNFTQSGDYFDGGINTRGHIYVIPNEINPESARSILKNAPTGVYLSVGAERGLLGAIMSPNITHLIQIDLVPEVVRYNQLNVILLKLAKNLNEFLNLRTGTHQDWLNKAHNANLNMNEFDLIQLKDSHSFYTSVESGARERLLDPNFFIKSSYLKDEVLFQKARALAIANRIQVLQGNLTDQNKLAEIAEQLKMKNLNLSVIDMSNAWEAKYIGPDGVDRVVTALSPAMNLNSILMTTSVAHCFKTHLCRWDFRGVQLKTLLKSMGLYGKYAPMSTLVSMKDFIKPNKLMSRLGFWKLYFIKKPVSAPKCDMLFSNTINSL